MNAILVTGAAGLIGRHFCARLEREGWRVRRLDLRSDPHKDVRHAAMLEEELKGISGIVHLAAVSRVIAGQRDPVNCHATNVAAVQRMLSLCLNGARPWVIFGSSREVYGQQDKQPVEEDAPQLPMNIYARSKVHGEKLVNEVRGQGLVANIIRFSSVYGCPQDHADRVAMAFAGAAARGGTIRMEGSGNTFDFTHIDDVVDGLYTLAQASAAGERLPAIHLVSGKGTSLHRLANLAKQSARHPVNILEAPPRDFDVSFFVGDPTRAMSLLGWRATTQLGPGFTRLINDLV